MSCTPCSSQLLANLYMQCVFRNGAMNVWLGSANNVGLRCKRSYGAGAGWIGHVEEEFRVTVQNHAGFVRIAAVEDQNPEISEKRWVSVKCTHILWGAGCRDWQCAPIGAGQCRPRCSLCSMVFWNVRIIVFVRYENLYIPSGKNANT